MKDKFKSNNMRYLKTTLMIIAILVGIILLDTLQALTFNNNPLLKIREYYNGGDLNYVDKGIIVDSFNCSNGKLHTVIKGFSYSCSLDNVASKYNDYKKITELKNVHYASTEILVKFDGILYGKSNAIIDYSGGNKKIGIIDKVIDSEYVPKLNNETNKKEILNAEVYDKTDKSIVLLYNNEYVLFEKIG